jgi:hypothetical protein
MIVSAAKTAGVEKNEGGIEELRTRLTNRDGNKAAAHLEKAHC